METANGCDAKKKKEKRKKRTYRTKRVSPYSAYYTSVAVLIGKLLNCLWDRSLVLNKYSVSLTLKRNFKTPCDCCDSIGGEYRDMLRDYNLSHAGGGHWFINLLIELADPTQFFK